MSFTKFRETRINTQRKNNISQVWTQIVNGNIDSGLKLKINNRYDKYKDLLIEHDINNIDEYIEHLKESKLHMLGLEIEPTRQTIDEKSQIEYLNAMCNDKVCKLPGTGKNSLAIRKDIHNIICPNDIKDKTVQRTKTFDAIDEKQTLYICKHIKESGGSQDNQLNDVIDQLQSCILHNQKYSKRNFKVVISGDYAIKNKDKLQLIIADNKEINILVLE